MMISCSVLMERLVLCGMGVLPEAVSVSSVPEDTILATNSKLMGKYFTVIPPVKDMGGNEIAPVLLVPVVSFSLAYSSKVELHWSIYKLSQTILGN